MTTDNTEHQAPTTGAGTSPPAPGTGGVPPAGASTLPTVAGAMIKWPDLIAQSGAGPDLDAYLQARNINRTATLALTGADLDQFKKAVVAPWAAGYTDSAGVAHKPKDTADAAVWSSSPTTFKAEDDWAVWRLRARPFSSPPDAQVRRERISPKVSALYILDFVCSCQSLASTSSAPRSSLTGNSRHSPPRRRLL